MRIVDRTVVMVVVDVVVMVVIVVANDVVVEKTGNINMAFCNWKIRQRTRSIKKSLC